MQLLVRRFVLAALVVLALLLSLGVVLGLALQTVQRDPQLLTQRVTALLPAESGLSLSLGSLDVRLLPLPRLVASDVRVTGPDFRLSIAYVVATPHLTDILRGESLPASLSLFRPQLVASLPVSSFLAAGEEQGAGEFPSIPSFRVRIQQGQAVLYARDGSALSLVNARCNLRGHERSVEGSFACSSLTVYDAAARPLAGLFNTRLEGEAPLKDWQTRDTRLRLQTQASLPPLLPEVRLALEVDGRPDDGRASADVRGTLRAASARIPFAAGGSVERSASENADVRLRQWRLELAEDSALLEGSVRLVDAEGAWAPALHGKLAVHRLSLTRWLDFARDLPPGLQWALDNITRGEASFELDATGLRVPRITARSSGSVFQGSGGVASWAAPVIALDLQAPLVDLGLALPEAVGGSPRPPFYTHPALTSAYDDPDAPSSSLSLGFDIRLGADQLRYGPLHMEKVAVRILPGPKDEGARIISEGAMYGGRLSAETLIGTSGSSDSCVISGTAHGINAAGLARDAAFFPFSAGTCDARLSIQSRGQKLDAFLQGLRGSLHVAVAQGRFRPGMDSGIQDFSRLTLDAALRGGRAVSEGGAGAVRLDALWKTRLEAPGLALDARLDGPLMLGGKARLRTEAAALQGNVRLSPAASLPQGLTAGIVGQCAFSAADSTFSLQRAALSMKGLEGQGDFWLDARGKTPLWRGRLHLQCPNLETLLKTVGQRIEVPVPLRNWRMSGSFRGQHGRLAVTDMQARTPLFSLEGDISAQWDGPRPVLRFDLASPHIDCDTFMAQAFPDTGRRTAETSAPWDLRFMKSLDAEGVLHMQCLTLWKCRISSLSVPLKLHEGRLSCNPVRANLYGAPLRASVDARFDSGVDLALDVLADGIDVERASADRADSRAAGGRASLELELRQHMTGGGQWLSSLNGLWKVSLVNGYVQERGRDGKRKGKPAPIVRCSASGNIRSGVVRSSDFFYLGDDMQARGEGWLHLVRQQMDCNLSVKMGRIPPFPVRVHGPLDKPETSIGAGTAILRILGSIAGSVGDVIGSLFGSIGGLVSK